MTGRPLERRLEALEAIRSAAWRPVWLTLPSDLTGAELDAWVAERRAELPPGTTVISTNVKRVLDR
jgi:hypothetical protein